VCVPGGLYYVLHRVSVVVNKNWILSFAAAMQMIADGASHRKIIFGCALLAPVLSICFVRIYQLLSQRDTKAGMQHFSPGSVRSATTVNALLCNTLFTHSIF